jgi:hypothetical protein
MALNLSPVGAGAAAGALCAWAVVAKRLPATTAAPQIDDDKRAIITARRRTHFIRESSALPLVILRMPHRRPRSLKPREWAGTDGESLYAGLSFRHVRERDGIDRPAAFRYSGFRFTPSFG